MIKIVMASAGSDTGHWLERKLKEKGVVVCDRRDDAQGLVSYGVRVHTRKPCLNANAGIERGKLLELQILREAGIHTPNFWIKAGAINWKYIKNGVLGRSDAHTGGRDIVLYTCSDEVTKNPSDFYTEVLGGSIEVRPWIYRGKLLGGYKKERGNPFRLKQNIHHHFGRNESDGWTLSFVRREQFPLEATNLACRALEALELDFGAPDILMGEDGKFYLLEMNTAPGANGPNAIGLTNLAEEVAEWEKGGFPKQHV